MLVLLALFALCDALKGEYREQLLVKCSYGDSYELANLLKTFEEYDEHVDVWTEHPNPDSGEILLRTDDSHFFSVPQCEELGPISDFVPVKQSLLASECDTLDSVPADFHSNYRSYEQIQRKLETIAGNFEDSMMRLVSIGSSIENRSLLAIHFGSDPVRVKPFIWIQAGLHAREWISPASAMYLIDWIASKLLENDPDVAKIVDNYEIAICPLANPDGYEYSRRIDRLWRKNMRVNEDGSLGVDLNRNYDNHWGEIGASLRNPSSEIYPGSRAASEPEIAAIQAYLSKIDPPERKLVGFDLHSASKQILRNYGRTMVDSPIESQEAELGRLIATKIQGRTRETYLSRKSASLYACTGSSEDYFFEKQGIFKRVKLNYLGMWGFIIELRDKSGSFILPPASIRPTGEDVVAILLATATYFNNKGQV